MTIVRSNPNEETLSYQSDKHTNFSIPVNPNEKILTPCIEKHTKFSIFMEKEGHECFNCFFLNGHNIETNF